MNSQLLLKLLKQYPAAVGGGFLCLILAIILFLRWDRLAELEFAFEEIDREAELIRQNEINAVNLNANLQTLQDYTAEIDTRLMEPEARTDHYRYFLVLAEDSAMHLDEPTLVEALGPGAGGQETTQYGQVEYALRASGDYPNVLNFTRNLQLGQYFCRIDRFEIHPLPTTSPAKTEPQVAAEIRVRFLTRGQ